MTSCWGCKTTQQSQKTQTRDSKPSAILFHQNKVYLIGGRQSGIHIAHPGSTAGTIQTAVNTRSSLCGLLYLCRFRNRTNWLTRRHHCDMRTKPRKAVCPLHGTDCTLFMDELFVEIEQICKKIEREDPDGSPKLAIPKTTSIHGPCRVTATSIVPLSKL